MTRKINILAAALIAATLGLAASSSTADAAVAGLGASTAKTTIEQSSPQVEQAKGRGGGFRGGFRGGHRFAGHRFHGHRWHGHHWKKHRYYKHYGYYGYYGSHCTWVKKWYHGYYKKVWVCY